MRSNQSNETTTAAARNLRRPRRAIFLHKLLVIRPQLGRLTFQFGQAAKSSLAQLNLSKLELPPSRTVPALTSPSGPAVIVCHATGHSCGLQGSFQVLGELSLLLPAAINNLKALRREALSPFGTWPISFFGLRPRPVLRTSACNRDAIIGLELELDPKDARRMLLVIQVGVEARWPDLSVSSFPKPEARHRNNEHKLSVPR